MKMPARATAVLPLPTSPCSSLFMRVGACRFLNTASAAAFLAGSTPAAEKRAIKKAFASGEVSVLCGTHAVLQGDVQFADLAFCVCDEQHRFGVAQRNALSEKGVSPDVLVMSATPIPRTLSLIFYGDLDITTIPDKPKERQEIVTAIVSARKYNDMLEYVRQETKRGRQAYFVCAKIEDDEGQVTSEIGRASCRERV